MRNGKFSCRRAWENCFGDSFMATDSMYVMRQEDPTQTVQMCKLVSVDLFTPSGHATLRQRRINVDATSCVMALHRR